jgi:hypothetical protein
MSWISLDALNFATEKVLAMDMSQKEQVPTTVHAEIGSVVVVPPQAAVGYCCNWLRCGFDQTLSSNSQYRAGAVHLLGLLLLAIA